METFIFKLKKVLEYMLSRVAAALLLAMTLMVLIQVVSRYVFQSPTAFTEELVRYLLIWTGFIGAAYAFITRQHMALIFFRDRLDPLNKRRLMFVVDVLILLIAVFVMVAGGTKLMFAVYKEYSPLLGISRSVVYSMAPISGVFIAIAQAINIYEDITGKTIADANQGGES